MVPLIPVVGDLSDTSADSGDGGAFAALAPGGQMQVGTTTVADLDVQGDLTVRGDFKHPSDQALKTDLRPADTGAALDQVLRIKLYEYDWKDTGRPGFGPMAQQLRGVLPEAVTEHPRETVADGDTGEQRPMLVVNYQMVNMLNMSATQQLAKKMDANAIRIDSHETRIAELEKDQGSAASDGGTAEQSLEQRILDELDSGPEFEAFGYPKGLAASDLAAACDQKGRDPVWGVGCVCLYIGRDPVCAIDACLSRMKAKGLVFEKPGDPGCRKGSVWLTAGARKRRTVITREINQQDRSGLKYAKLHKAAKANNLETAAELLQCGASVNLKSLDRCETPLHLAAREGAVSLDVILYSASLLNC